MQWGSQKGRDEAVWLTLGKCRRSRRGRGAAARRGLRGFQGGHGADGALGPRRVEPGAPGGVCRSRRRLLGRGCLTSTAVQCHYHYCRKVMEDGPLPDLRDIELKLGRKVPESLARSLRGEEPVAGERDRDPCGESFATGGGGCSRSSSCCSFPPSLSSSSSPSPTAGSPRRSHSSALERLETKLHLLRQEMVSVLLQSRGSGPSGKGVLGEWGWG